MLLGCYGEVRRGDGSSAAQSFSQILQHNSAETAEACVRSERSSERSSPACNVSECAGVGLVSEECHHRRMDVSEEMDEVALCLWFCMP